MMTGWRARLHYWSRRRDVLQKLSVGIVLGAFLLSWLIVQGNPVTHMTSMMDPIEQTLRNDWQRLRHATEPNPRAFTHWLRKLMPSLKLLAESLEMPETDWPAYSQTGKILAYEVEFPLRFHLTDIGARKLAEDYLEACLAGQTSIGQSAAARVREQARLEKPPPYANELHASLLLRTDHDSDALLAFMREGTLFPHNTENVRETALRLALHLEDQGALRSMMESGWLATAPSLLEHQAGIVLGDLGLQWRGLLKHRLETLPFAALALTVLAAGLWYVLLVQHSPAQPWRWAWPIAPIVAGIASIWPTVSMIAWQEDTMGIGGDDVPFPYDLWHLIIGVGFREELCKLALASLFMPWLVWRRAPGMALMSGAFIGLGFALEENIDYYQGMGESVALGRFLSANFMHIAMTGLTTHALYDMLRSRFHRTQQFLSTFAVIVVAHAVYDYDMPEITGLSGYVPMLILAALAWQFWDAVEREMPHTRQTLSPAAIFLIGTAIVIATSLLVTAVKEGSWQSVIDAATSCASMLPVVVIYWRRFEGGLSAR